MNNEARKLTEQQISRLYVFTKEHFVEHYDLQTELVDHMANAIETKWIKEPQLDFEVALQQEFKKFGIFGFMDVVERRQMALTKRYNKLIWRYFKEFFRLPKIMLTAVFIAVTFQALLIEPLIYQATLLLVFILSIIKFFRTNAQYRKKVKETGKKWMLEEQIYRCGGTGIYMYVAFQAFRLLGDSASCWYTLAISVLLVVLILFDYIILFVVPEKAEQHLAEMYPEYKFENVK